MNSLADFGTTVAVSAIFSANTYVGMNTHYWTVITWIVVFGSSIVMLLWIIVYSFFFSSDFINEMQILFGGIPFWATVVFSTVVSLGPRFVCKFFSSAYFPLDKEIVREMWVKGDLKDQLGIRHRRAKNRNGDTLEAAPMFGHGRSQSEMSLSNTPYEPAMTSSPGPGNQPRRTDLDTPPLDANLSPRGYNRQNETPASYYSVSDIPPPSPLPSPKYRYTDGSITSTPPSRRTSIATTHRTTRAFSPPPLSPPIINVPASHGRSTPYDPGDAYEMDVRNPPSMSSHSHHHVDRSTASEASYATAYDGFHTSDETVVGSPPASSVGHLAPGPRSGEDGYHSGQYLQSPTFQQQQQEQPSDPQYDDRRASTVSWRGGRAL